MMYFTGQFDGTTFTPDEREYPLWLDYGMDNYAGVTWSNTGDRRLMIGWMNNWQYAGSVPCSPWRSAMTLPRELKLTEYNGKPLLCCPVVSEINNIAGEWQNIENVSNQANLNSQTSSLKSYQLRLTITLDKNSTITLSNSTDEKYAIDINAAARTLTAHRTAASGRTDFNGFFSIPSMQAPLNVSGNTVTLDFFVDQSSVELLTNHGAMSMTNLVFPQTIYDRLSITGADCEAQYRSLSSIWN
jgi:fructan beta-fructosidase